MSNLIINPLAAGNVFDTVKHYVLINRQRRIDCYCRKLTISSGTSIGSIELVFPNAAYDSIFLFENDLIEVGIFNYGLLSRGTVSGRDATNKDALIYNGADLIGKLLDVYFLNSYNQLNIPINNFSILNENAEVVDFPATLRKIADHAQIQYNSWHNDKNSGDFILSFNTGSFIDKSPEAIDLFGITHLQGLQQAAEAIDSRYRIGIKHDESTSTVFCFRVGDSRNPRKNIIRGTDTSRFIDDQPNGFANAIDIRKTSESINTYSEIKGIGDYRLREHTFTLVNGWNEFADGLDLPTSNVNQVYFTHTDALNIINHWDAYTKPTIDNKFSNPKFKQAYTFIAKRFLIPEIADQWYFSDNTTITGFTSRQVPIVDNKMVQYYQNKPITPFLVYKKIDSDTLYIKFDGFSIEDSTYVELSEPLLDTVNNCVATGSDGKYTEQDGDDNAVYQCPDKTLSTIDALSTAVEADSAYLLLGKTMVPYRITETGTDTVTVEGNLTGAVTDEKYTNYFILTKSPIVRYSTSGSGTTKGVYTYDDTAPVLPEALDNTYAGMFLVIGEFDNLKPTGLPGSYKKYKIAWNTLTKLQLEDDTEDLSSAGTTYMIVNPNFETKRFYEWVKLQAVYQSGQRLEYFSGDTTPALGGKRQLIRNNNDYGWNTLDIGAYKIDYYFDTENDEAQPVAELTVNTQFVDYRYDLDKLKIWADKQLAGENVFDVSMNITLPMITPDIHIGDNISVNGVIQGCTATEITYDFERSVIDIHAESK